MKVLHVSMGDPFTHEGGLNRYCLDLYKTQKQLGHKVAVLYPGVCTNRKNIRIKKVGEGKYEINHALPVPITYGIDIPQRYMTPISVNEYYSFLLKINPDIVHVHSFMGIHKEFFEACDMLEISTVFTTHDYFPFCFKCNLVDRFGNICTDGFNNNRCSICNATGGLSYKTQLLMQSKIYQSVKNLTFIKQIKKKVNHGVNQNDAELSCVSPHSFIELHDYYFSIMSSFSAVHCNSVVSKKLYEKSFPGLKYDIIPITHSGIKKAGHKRKKSNKLRISYFGGASSHKGYEQLKEVVRLLPDDNSWEMNLYGGVFPNDINDSRIHVRGYFNKNEENSVWSNTDLLLFISQWPESFGFSVLEALALDIPVICSDMAGASILLEGIGECVYNHSDVHELVGKINYFIDAYNYSEIQRRINELELDISMIDHTKKIIDLYNEVITNDKNSVH